MKSIKNITLIYFSPTGTTRKVLEGIAAGVRAENVAHLDLTLPATETGLLGTVSSDLVLFGVPVYAGRVPQAAVDRISILKGQDVPAVIVAVYGNRAYEDALVELKDLVEGAGFMPMGAAAFIGEHSFSSDKAPIAVGRPDGEDIKEANAFGRRIRSRLENARASAELHCPDMPGNHPYKERRFMPKGSPVTKDDLCTLCGVCAGVCPVGAVSVTDCVSTDEMLCIYCCACIKNCLKNARVMTVPKINETAGWLSKNCAERKSPEFFL